MLRPNLISLCAKLRRKTTNAKANISTRTFNQLLVLNRPFASSEHTDHLKRKYSTLSKRIDYRVLGDRHQRFDRFYLKATFGRNTKANMKDIQLTNGAQADVIVNLKNGISSDR